MKVCEIPSDTEAEKFVLGSALTHFDDLDLIMDKLREEMFFENQHSLIFKALEEIWVQEKKVSYLDVAKVMATNNTLEKAGGVSYLKDLEIQYSGASMVIYCDAIIEAWKRRKLVLMYHSALKMANGGLGSKELVEICDEALMLINGHAENKPATLSEILSNFDGARSMADVIEEKYTNFRDGKSNITKGISSGYEGIDNLLGGFINKRLTILGARPSMGKSEFIVQMVSSIINKNETVMVFSMEMTKEEWVDRLVGISASVHFSGFNRLSEMKKDQIIESIKWLQNKGGNLIIDDQANLTAEQIKARARREICKRDVKAIFVDHLGLVEQKGNSRYEKVSEISRKLKVMAKELDIPVFCLCQLNRKVEAREKATPTMSDLRDSGSIEQDADSVLLLHRPDYYDKNDSPGLVKIIVDKNRHGERGVVRFGFNKDTALLAEIKEF